MGLAVWVCRNTKGALYGSLRRAMAILPSVEAVMTSPAKTQAHPLGVKVKGTAKGLTVELEHADALEAIFGTDQPEQAAALLGHCLKVLKRDESSDDFPANDERMFVLSIIRDLAPRDAVERMLAVQMAATHVATVRSARWLASTETLPQVEAHYTGFNKLARTFASQVEALRKHRNGGQQKVIVEHVTVNEGGQAIVGHMQHGGREKHD